MNEDLEIHVWVLLIGGDNKVDELLDRLLI